MCWFLSEPQWNFQQLLHKRESDSLVSSLQVFVDKSRFGPLMAKAIARKLHSFTRATFTNPLQHIANDSEYTLFPVDCWLLIARGSDLTETSIKNENLKTVVTFKPCRYIFLFSSSIKQMRHCLCSEIICSPTNRHFTCDINQENPSSSLFLNNWLDH